MPSVPDECRDIFLTIKEGIQQYEAPNDGKKFELWCVENVIKKYYGIQDDLISIPGQGNGELCLDIGAKTSEGTYLLVQVKFNESDGTEQGGYARCGVADFRETAALWTHITATPEGENGVRNTLIAEMNEVHGDNLRDNVQLVFITNTEMAGGNNIRDLKEQERIEIFDISRLTYLIQNEVVSESNALDVRGWEWRDGVGFGIARAEDIASFVTVEIGESSFKNDLLFSENLRFQIDTKKSIKIKEAITNTIREDSPNFLAKNNGLLMIGSKNDLNQEAYSLIETSEHSQRYRDLIRKKNSLAADIVNQIDGLPEEESDEKTQMETDIAELGALRVEILQHIQDMDRNIQTFKFREVQIVNGGQTASSLYDFFTENEMESNAEVLIKFVAAQEGDSDFRTAVAVASNTMNPIEERDETSNHIYQRRIHEIFRDNEMKIIYDHKAGMEGALRARGDEILRTYRNGTGALGLRLINNETYGKIMLTQFHDLPHKAKSGKESLSLFSVLHENYRNAFEESSTHRMKIALFGMFVNNIADVTKKLSSKTSTKKTAWKAELDAELNALAEEQRRERKEMRELQWSKTMGFLQYWDWTLVKLTYEVLNEIARVHYGSEGTILLDYDNQNDALLALLNLMLTEDIETDFTTDQTSLDRLWYSSVDRFTTMGGDDGNMLLQSENSTLLLREENIGACSDILPSLFGLIRRIETVVRSKYADVDQTAGSKAFQSNTLWTDCRNKLFEFTNNIETIREKFRFSISLGVVEAPREEKTLQQYTDEFANIVGALGAGLVTNTWIDNNREKIANLEGSEELITSMSNLIQAGN